MWEWRTEERTRARPRRRRGGGAFEDQFIRGKQDKRAQKTSFMSLKALEKDSEGNGEPWKGFEL